MSEPTVFAFHCSYCGAQPGRVALADLLALWKRAPQSDLEALLAFYARILDEVRAHRRPWHSRRFIRILDRLIRDFHRCELPHDDTCSLDGPVGTGRTVLAHCPLCHTPAGRRPEGADFALWRNADRVQVANFLYETGLVLFALLRALPVWAQPAYLGRLGRLLLLNQAALACLELQECPLCGRHTAALTGAGTPEDPLHCRWCKDTGVGLVVRVSNQGEAKAAATDELPERLPNEIVPRQAAWRRTRRKRQSTN